MVIGCGHVSKVDGCRWVELQRDPLVAEGLGADEI